MGGLEAKAGEDRMWFVGRPTCKITCALDENLGGSRTCVGETMVGKENSSGEVY